jgi:uncharacterized protein (TIGR03067 family)
MKSASVIAVTLALCAGPLTAAPGPKDEKDEVKKFEGEWTFVSWEHSGQTLPKEVLDITKWSVKGDKYSFEMGEQQEEGTIKIDASKKPATLDFDITSGNDKGKKQVGIYKIDGDTMTICLARPGEEKRPSEFKSTEEDGHILVTIKKKKE